jgi:hypothetical protein
MAEVGPKQQQLNKLRQAKMDAEKRRQQQLRKDTVPQLQQTIDEVAAKHALRMRAAAKPASDATKLVSAVPVAKPRKVGNKGGRPLIGNVAMTSTERARRSRERKRKKDAEK